MKSLVLAVMGLLCSMSVSAEDFEVDGIYYNITSQADKTVAVTYQGSYYDSYSNEYSGEVTIPESITYSGNTYSVTSIGDYAFCGCSSLTSVEFPNSVTSIGDQAFRSCSSLTSVEIPNSVTSIGEWAFCGCSSLTSVEIPHSVTSIGACVFFGCSSLTSVEIPNSVTSIGDDAFNGTAWYNNQPDGVIYAGKVLYEYKGTMPVNTSISIEDGTVSISPCAFSGCSSLTSVEIPNSVTSIGSDAFYGTAWYNNQPDGVIYAGKVLYKYKGTMPANTSITIEDGTVSISPKAFYNCSSLTSVEIPNSVTSIGESAFFYCSSLTSVEIPNSVASIGFGAFGGCSSLTSVEIPNSVTSIGDAAFAYCSSLTSIVVAPNNPKYDSRDNCNAIIESESNTLIAGCPNTTIPNSVTSIGVGAFAGCSSLTSVEIPNSVTSIGEYAFESCRNLKQLISYAEVPPICDSYGFSDVNTQECTLYVPYGAKSAYASTDGWNDFTNIVEMEPYYDLTVSAAGYATLYLDYATEIPEGVEVYTAKEVDGIWLKMAQVGDVLPANTAVIVKAPAGTYTFVQTATETSTIADNLLKGSATDAYIDVPSNSKAFVLSMVDGEVGMYLAKLTDGRFLNNANKAYLLLDNNKLGLSDEELDTSVGGAQLSLRFDFGSATGIDAVQTETEKVIYDLYGRKVNQITGSGLYIIGGKKVYVR